MSKLPHKLGIKWKFHHIYLWKQLFLSAKITLQITHSYWSNLVTHTACRYRVAWQDTHALDRKYRKGMLVHCTSILTYRQLSRPGFTSPRLRAVSLFSVVRRAKRETRKWPRAWLMARDGRGCRPRFALLAASPLPRVHCSHWSWRKRETARSLYFPQRPVRRLNLLLCQEWCQYIEKKKKKSENAGRKAWRNYFLFFLKEDANRRKRRLNMFRKNSFKSLCLSVAFENIKMYSNKEKPLCKDPVVHSINIKNHGENKAWIKRSF